METSLDFYLLQGIIKVILPQTSTMRGTVVLLRQHLDRQAKVYWMTQGRLRVPDTGAEALLAAKGIPVVNPKDILTPPYPRQ